MSLSLLNLFCSSDNKLFYASATSLDKVILSFFQGESPPVAFTLLALNPTGGYAAPWSKVNPAQYSLRLGLFLTSNGTQLGFQDTFTNDAAAVSKYANFDFNSAVIDPLMTGASLPCTFEAEIKDANGKASKVQQAVTLYKQFITPTTATVAAGEIAATLAMLKAFAIPQDGSAAQNPCDGFIIKSRPSGIPILVYFDDAGELHHETQG